MLIEQPPSLQHVHCWLYNIHRLASPIFCLVRVHIMTIWPGSHPAPPPHPRPQQHRTLGWLLTKVTLQDTNSVKQNTSCMSWDLVLKKFMFNIKASFPLCCLAWVCGYPPFSWRRMLRHHNKEHARAQRLGQPRSTMIFFRLMTHWWTIALGTKFAPIVIFLKLRWTLLIQL